MCTEFLYWKNVCFTTSFQIYKQVMDENEDYINHLRLEWEFVYMHEIYQESWKFWASFEWVEKLK